ncbi:MAG: DUF927 domain-containing protein [Methanobacterium sp.]
MKGVSNIENQESIFDKCPAVDRDLQDWTVMYPSIKETIFGDFDYKEMVHALANIKNVSEDGKEIIEYGFTEESIKLAVDAYKGGEHEQEEISTFVKECRKKDSEERLYANNIIKDWREYEVPDAERGYYWIGGQGIYRYAKTVNEESGEEQFIRKDVCRTPFVLCGVSEPLKEDTIYYKVRYAAFEGEVKEFWASQSDLLSKNELKKLFLPKGINCPENTLLVETLEYISRSIADFGQRLKKEHSTKQCGWNEDKSTFVIGNRAVTSKGIEPVLTVGCGKGFPELDKKGTIEDWVDGVKTIMEYDVVRFKFYDAFTAPLNAVLGLESHISDHYGNTSVGKTFSAWMGLSGVGDAEGLTIGAKSSAKGILVTIRDFSDLPLLIDESSDAGEHLADLVYPLTSNKGRVKSTVDGQRDGGEEYHTTVLFTGERPIRDCLNNSGQQYRVNELDDSLPDLPTKEIKRVTKAIRENHGHIIELYIQEILKRIENKSLYVLYENCFDILPENASNIEGRSKAIFAGIMTAGKILEPIFEKIGLPKKNAVDIVEKYFKKCIQDKPVELEYIRALRVVLDWVHIEYGRFGEVEVVEVEKTNSAAEGLDKYINDSEKVEIIAQNDKNKRYGYIDADFIDIIGTAFTKKMKEEKFSPAKMKEDWFKTGICDSDSSTDRLGTYHFKRDKKSIAGVRIFRPIAEELLGSRINDTSNESMPEDKKIMVIFKTIRFLTEVKSQADINLIRLITEIPDLDDMLKILTTYGKIIKIDQTTYKAL